MRTVSAQNLVKDGTPVTAIANWSPWLWLAFPVAGAGVGWLLDLLARWIATLSWFPWRRIFEFVASGPHPQTTILVCALGALGGLVLASMGAAEAVVVTVGRSEISVTRNETTDRFDTVAVKGGFVDEKRFVLLGGAGEELVNEPVDSKLPRVARALGELGIPWHNEDPYRTAYRRWVHGEPELSERANTVLASRERALDLDNPRLATSLRREASGLGIVIRDERGRQYWRRDQRGLR